MNSEVGRGNKRFKKRITSVAVGLEAVNFSRKGTCGNVEGIAHAAEGMAHELAATNLHTYCSGGVYPRPIPQPIPAANGGQYPPYSDNGEYQRQHRIFSLT